MVVDKEKVITMLCFLYLPEPSKFWRSFVVVFSFYYYLWAFLYFFLSSSYFLGGRGGLIHVS